MAIFTETFKKTYTLELSENEVRVLLTILNKVGGNPENSLRFVSDQILKVLDEKIEAYPYEVANYDSNYQGVYFSPGSLKYAQK